MSDNKSNVGPHLEHTQVLEAVKEKGPFRDNVVKYLQTLK